LDLIDHNKNEAFEDVIQTSSFLEQLLVYKMEFNKQKRTRDSISVTSIILR